MGGRLSGARRASLRRLARWACVALALGLCAASCRPKEEAGEGGEEPGASAHEMGGGAAHKFGGQEPDDDSSDEAQHAEAPDAPQPAKAPDAPQPAKAPDAPQPAKASECQAVEAWKGNAAFRNYGYPGKRAGFVEFWHADLATAHYLCGRKGFGSGMFTQTGAPDAQGWAPYGNLEVVRVLGDGTIEALCTSGADCNTKKVPFIQALRCCK